MDARLRVSCIRPGSLREPRLPAPSLGMGIHRVLSQLSSGPFAPLTVLWGFHHGSDGKESACNAGDPGLIPGSGRSPGEGNGTPLQCSCLRNPMDRGAWLATVHGIAKSQTRLSDWARRQIPMDITHMNKTSSGFSTTIECVKES